MATFMSPFRVPRCTSCIRRVASLDISEATFPFHRQLRGKKKTTKLPHTAKVRLLRDIRGFGRQGRHWKPLKDRSQLKNTIGAIIPVAPGRMRNVWYPQGKAEYVTNTQLRGMNMRELVVERDFTFIPKHHTDGEIPVDRDADTVIDVEMKLLAV